MARAEAPPLTPGARQADELLRQELAKPEYQQHKGLLQTVLDWLGDQLDRLLNGAGGAVPAIAWLVVLLVVILLATFAATSLRGGRVRAASKVTDAVLGEQQTTGADLRRRAADAEAGADLQQATLDYFRAIAVRGVERALVDPAPGLTAHEIARVLGARFPDRSTALFAAASTFDAMLYGDRPADAADCATMRELDRSLERIRPVVPVHSPTGAGMSR